MEKNNIIINKKVFEKIKIIENKNDIIVPDIKKDIVSIVNANSNSYIRNEELSDSRYRFEGKINTNIIYLAENGTTQCIQVCSDFVEFIEEKQIDNDTKVRYIIEEQDVKCSVINERKVNLDIKLVVKFEFYKDCNLEYIDEASIDSNIERKTDNITINSIIAQNTATTTLQESLKIDNVVPIFDILKFNIDILNIENKVSYNKILSKAETNIRILYLLEDNTIGMYEADIPITNFFDMVNVSEEDDIDVNYKIRNIDINPDSQDKSCINLNIDFEVYCISTKKNEIVVVQDLYGIDKNIVYESQNIDLCLSCDAQCSKISVNENVFIEDIRKIYDVEYKININNIDNLSNGTQSGYIDTEIYYSNGNSLCVKKIKLPFEFTIEEEMNNINIEFTRKHYKLSGEDIIFDLSLEVNNGKVEHNNINIITNYIEEEYENSNNYSMVIYYVKKGDTIWNIAREYRVTVESIVQMNKLENENMIYPGDRLYIML